MYLFLTDKSKWKKATKDIVVYKTLRNVKSGKGFSPYYGKLYEKYNIHTSNIKIIKQYYKNEFIVTEGLHSCLTKFAAKRHSVYRSTIVEMIIPKGAWYIIGKNNEVVSNILIW